MSEFCRLLNAILRHLDFTSISNKETLIVLHSVLFLSRNCFVRGTISRKWMLQCCAREGRMYRQEKEFLSPSLIWQVVFSKDGYTISKASWAHTTIWHYFHQMVEFIFFPIEAEDFGECWPLEFNRFDDMLLLILDQDMRSISVSLSWDGSSWNSPTMLCSPN